MYWEHFVLCNPLLKMNFFVVLLWGLKFCDHLLLEKKGTLKMGRWGPWENIGLCAFDMYY